MTCVALIPARKGSKRIEGKNVRRLAGHPVIAYTIRAAIDSGIFDHVIVSTDDETYADIARHYGAETPFMRPAEFAADLSPDIDWIRHAIANLETNGSCFDAFSILRPTSPFRQPDTIQRAWRQFNSTPGIDSLRAVQLCTEHPGKMWVIKGDIMVPALPVQLGETPWHSMPYQALPAVYIQNASLEIAWTRVVTELGTIAGNVVAPFLTQSHEGLDLNKPGDWAQAEILIADGHATLPQIEIDPYPT
jgi:CMP-N,N'-diacetyllegionaminic acid synthase